MRVQKLPVNVIVGRISSSPSLLFCNSICVCWRNLSFWVFCQHVLGKIGWQGKGGSVRAEIWKQGHHRSALDLQQSRTDRRVLAGEKETFPLMDQRCSETQNKCKGFSFTGVKVPLPHCSSISVRNHVFVKLQKHQKKKIRRQWKEIT